VIVADLNLVRIAVDETKANAPLVIDGDGVLALGHTRLAGYLALGDRAASTALKARKSTRLQKAAIVVPHAIVCSHRGASPWTPPTSIYPIIPGKKTTDDVTGDSE